MARGPVLFVCVENAGRSQMAEALAKKRDEGAERGHDSVYANQPTVVDVMRERGIDLSSDNPKTLTPELIQEARLVVTLG